MSTNKHHNRLEYFRKRMRFSTAHVAHLLGHKDSSTYCDYERGDRLPSLINAFQLGAILRVQVEFLYPELYDSLRSRIRADEEQMGGQPEREAGAATAAGSHDV